MITSQLRGGRQIHAMTGSPAPASIALDHLHSCRRPRQRYTTVGVSKVQLRAVPPAVQQLGAPGEGREGGLQDAFQLRFLQVSSATLLSFCTHPGTPPSLQEPSPPS